MDKIARLRQEIERHRQVIRVLNEHTAPEGMSKTCAIFQYSDSILSELLSFLKTLSEEPDKSLEEAAEEYGKAQYGRKASLLPDRCRGCYAPIVYAFKAGAEWQASQMPMPEDTVLFNKGVAEGRRLEREDMMKDAEKDLGWHSVEESLPPVDEEVIVLADRLNLGALFAISFGHIVDRMHCSDYNGWNIPGVKYWMPMPKLPKEEEK